MVITGPVIVGVDYGTFQCQKIKFFNINSKNADVKGETELVTKYRLLKTWQHYSYNTVYGGCRLYINI